MIFQLLWKNGKLNWPNRARTRNSAYGCKVFIIKYLSISFAQHSAKKVRYFDLQLDVNDLYQEIIKVRE